MTSSSSSIVDDDETRQAVSEIAAALLPFDLLVSIFDVSTEIAVSPWDFYLDNRAICDDLFQQKKLIEQRMGIWLMKQLYGARRQHDAAGAGAGARVIFRNVRIVWRRWTLFQQDLFSPVLGQYLDDLLLRLLLSLPLHSLVIRTISRHSAKQLPGLLQQHSSLCLRTLHRFSLKSNDAHQYGIFKEISKANSLACVTMCMSGVDTVEEPSGLNFVSSSRSLRKLKLTSMYEIDNNWSTEFYTLPCTLHKISMDWAQLRQGQLFTLLAQPVLGHLQHLRALTLSTPLRLFSHNADSEQHSDSSKQFFECLSQCSQLQKLKLDHVPLMAADMELLFSTLRRLPRFRSLCLQVCAVIDRDSWPDVMQTLRQMTNLEELTISMAKLSTMMPDETYRANMLPGQLLSAALSLPRLKRLQLQPLMRSDPVNDFKSCSTLEDITIVSNWSSIRDRFFGDLCEQLATRGGVSRLCLRNQTLVDFYCVVQSLTKFDHLQCLELSGIDKQFWEQLGYALTVGPAASLRALVFYDPIPLDMAPTVFSSILSLPHLEDLCMYNSMMTPQIASVMASQITQQAQPLQLCVLDTHPTTMDTQSFLNLLRVLQQYAPNLIEWVVGNSRIDAKVTVQMMRPPVPRFAITYERQTKTMYTK